MNDKINKDFEEFQKELSKRNKKLKYITKFELSPELDDEIKELKEKDVIL